MPWYVHLLLVVGPLAIVGAVFLGLDIVTKITGVSGCAPGWQVRCTKCNHVRDAGEAGMIRIGAASVGKRTFGYCEQCRGLRWMAVEGALAKHKA